MPDYKVYIKVPEGQAARTRFINTVNKVFLNRGEHSLTEEEFDQLMDTNGLEFKEVNEKLTVRFVPKGDKE